VPESLGEARKPGTVGLDDEEDDQPAAGLSTGRRWRRACWPTVGPVVPYPSSATTPGSSCPGTLGVRSRPARLVHVVGQFSFPEVNPAVRTRTMTSFSAA
jgi:hypothetical protein